MMSNVSFYDCPLLRIGSWDYVVLRNVNNTIIFVCVFAKCVCVCVFAKCGLQTSPFNVSSIITVIFVVDADLYREISFLLPAFCKWHHDCQNSEDFRLSCWEPLLVYSNV